MTRGEIGREIALLLLKAGAIHVNNPLFSPRAGQAPSMSTAAFSSASPK